MRKDKDYWGPIFEEFVTNYPDLGEQIVDWYPSGQMEITVKLTNDKKYTYDPEHHYDTTEDEWRENFSRNLSRKLYNSGMSQDLLAIETSISPTTINKYIKGRATPSAYNLCKIAEVLKCSPTELTR